MTQPRINGNRHSYASIELSARGRAYTGVKEINYKDTLDPGVARGTSPIALGRTVGDYEAEGDLTLFLEEFEQLVNDLGSGYGEIDFDIVVTFSKERVAPPTTHRLRGVRIKEVDNSNSQGTDPTEVKLSLHIIVPIERSGKTLVSPDR